MFYHHEKKPHRHETRLLSDLIAIIEPSQLLDEPRRCALLQSIVSACIVDTQEFADKYLKVIHGLIKHCQRLPASANHYYARAGGVLDYALNRTEAALTLFRQQIIQDENTALSHEQQLWLYVLFSASVLRGIGKLYSDYHVDLFDNHGQLLKPWNALLENLANNGSCYHYDFQNSRADDLSIRLTVLLAYKIMPTSGFAMIAQHPPALNAWLALLHEDANTTDPLAAILERADGIAIARDINDYLLKNAHTSGGRGARIGTFIDNPLESSIDRERSLGAEFIAWLTHALKTGELTINKDPLLMAPQGMLLSRELFQRFMQHHPDVKHWHAVQKGVFAWGLHVHENGDSNVITDPIILKHYACVLPAEVAVEIILKQTSGHNVALQHLSTNGKWVAHNAATAFLNKSHKFHE